MRRQKELGHSLRTCPGQGPVCGYYQLPILTLYFIIIVIQCQNFLFETILKYLTGRIKYLIIIFKKDYYVINY